MNQKEMMAAIYFNAHFDESRDNSDYKFTDAEQARFYRAVEACRERVWAMAEKHYSDDVSEKIYGF